MSSDECAISVDDVTKYFEIFGHPRNQLKQFIYPRFQKVFGLPQQKYYTPYFALDGVSFRVAKGEFCGLVGLNGSGKSTLLQIVAGTLSPTSGSVSASGRITALLELGSGFSPEFTGRENVYMNGALLGLAKAQIDELLCGIEAFADIGLHFDQPLSTYSSGMQMRLAFSVATSFQPDILIIDEALAVGDAYFQRKCFQRLEDFKRNGGTLLFVSHDLNAVKQLCDSAILLDRGQMTAQGRPREVIDLYHGIVAKRAEASKSIVVDQEGKHCGTWHKATTVTTSGDAELIDFKILNSNNESIAQIESEQVLTVTYVVRAKKRLDKPAFGIIVRDRVGLSIFETSTYAMRVAEPPIESGAEVAVSFTFRFNLRAGHYSFSIGVANRGFDRSEFEEICLLMHDVEQIQVVDSGNPPFYGGVYNMAPSVHVERSRVTNE